MCQHRRNSLPFSENQVKNSPRGFLAAAVVVVRADAAVRTDAAVLLAVVVPVPFLVSVAEPV